MTLHDQLQKARREIRLKQYTNRITDVAEQMAKLYEPSPEYPAGGCYPTKPYYLPMEPGMALTNKESLGIPRCICNYSCDGYCDDMYVDCEKKHLFP